MSAASLMRCGNLVPRSDTSVTAGSASDFDPDSFTTAGAHIQHFSSSTRFIYIWPGSAECTR
ncbi:unnamed protein product [Tenebrio molitor]|nr:unnamed protein product [Tenebrio molitor]